MHSPTISWAWKNQQSRCSHGPWGSTIPISLLPMKKQKVTGVWHLTSYFLLPNLTVMSDHRFPDGISSVDRYLSLRCYFGIFKRVVPLHTRLLRLAHSSPFFGFLVSLSSRGISVKRSNPGHSWKQTKGNKLPRKDLESDLVKLMHNQIHLST